MRRSLWVSTLIFGTCAVAATQTMPTSSGGCSVSASGLNSCEWLGSVPDRARIASEEEYNWRLRKSQSGVFVTRFTLAAGAPLTLPMADYDVLLVGLSDGMLVNETAKAAPAPIKVAKGSAMLVRRNERMTLRNTSEHELELVAIENRQEQADSNR